LPVTTNQTCYESVITGANIVFPADKNKSLGYDKKAITLTLRSTITLSAGHLFRRGTVF
jgi:hypothetical protein